MPRVLPKKKPRGRPKKYLAPRRAVVVKLDEPFYKALKKYAVERDSTLNDVIAEALSDWWDGKTE